MSTPERILQDIVVPNIEKGSVRVSTVFLGIDVSFGVKEPVLFETMILGGVRDRQLYRYCTWEDAQRAHSKIVEAARAGLSLHEDPEVLKALEIAGRTAKLASDRSVESLIERSFLRSAFYVFADAAL